MPFQETLLRQEPLLIQPEILTAFAQRCASFSETIKELLGEPDQPRIENGIGILPVKGVIGKGIYPIEKLFGATDVDDLVGAVAQFESDPNVRGIFLDVDSPGGTVTGVPELATRIANLTKPSVAFTSSLAASAAYWIGSQTDQLLVTPSASVGSVGVYMPFLDASAAFAQRGLFVDVIKAGRYKGMGLPGTSLSEEDRALLQERVDQIHTLFKTTVRRKRAYVREDSMEGQVFFGTEAVSRNLATAAVSSMGEALGELTRMF